jgi:glycosyltransferase involved in cell wall biosynthesis
MAARLAVVIPSRTQPSQVSFLTRAIASIRAQKAQGEVAIEVLVCLDKGASPPPLPDQKDVRFVEAPSRGQAAALNAGASQTSADYIAFLEDDDHWHAERVTYALRALETADFTSTTQLELDHGGVIARINDFPTPSGWFMPMSCWERVGQFNESFRWHLDNEWLGRLGDSGLRRMHLVEATAPIDVRYIAEVRPWLLKCLQLGGPKVSLGRHPTLVPLVYRLIHANSGMAVIESDPQAQAVSKAECQSLMGRFGRIPW